ncbi:MAG: hypothetical protein FWH52_00755 [Synergistaceae bacterium]|nr:hypothetical protein [Synergistaceae bacterium]
MHYSDEIIGPWVDTEAMRAGFNEKQKDEYSKAFISELRLDEAEPFLVSIYAFGQNPLEFRPFGDNISLINSDGDRFKPISYERVFDNPISGMVQGLVFFKKQSNKNFTLSLRGTGVFDERIFSFQNQDRNVVYESPPIIASNPRQEDLIVIDMPPIRPPAREEIKKEEDLEVIPIVIEDNFKIEDSPASIDNVIDNQIKQDSNNLYISKEKALQNFINSWIANDIPAMYDMLSAETRKMYSLASFEKEVRKSADFRRGLLSGYKIDWVGEERARVTTTKRLLVMRTLINRTLGVVRIGKEWLIVW